MVLRLVAAPIALAAFIVAAGPPIYAALDLTPFAALAGTLLGGGIIHAINQARRTPAEIESISVATLSSALEQMRILYGDALKEIASLTHKLEECQKSKRRSRHDQQTRP